MLSIDKYLVSSADQDKAVSQNSFIKSFGFMVFSVSLMACACYLARAASVDMFTRVESCFSECAREMVQCHNYVTPLYQGKEFFDKPILTYWLIALCYKAIGVSVFAARLPSIISAVLSVGLVAYCARKIYGDFVGILAAAILATSIGFADMASTAMSDMLLCFFDLVSVFALFWGYKNENKRTALFCVASAAMAFGFLTKSLIAIFFPVTTFVIFLILYKKINIIKPRHMLFGALIFAAIILPWHIALYEQSGMRALSWMYLHEQIQRFSTNIVQYNFGHPFYYMTVSMLSQLLPWSIFLPVVIWRLVKDFRHKENNSATQFTSVLLIFLLLDILVFSASKSNWGYYNLPALPAASILISKYSTEWLSTRPGFLGKYSSAILASIFIGACIFSLLGSLFILTVKMKDEVPHNFGQLIIRKCPKDKIVIHTDLFAQYFLCDWILFKTAQMPLYNYQNDLIKTLDENRNVCVILPQNRFNELPKSLKDNMQVLAAEKYKFIPFPLSPLKTEDKKDSKVTLVLATK